MLPLHDQITQVFMDADDATDTIWYNPITTLLEEVLLVVDDYLFDSMLAITIAAAENRYFWREPCVDR